MGVSEGPHRFGLRVYYEDTDLAGIVYYANYLKFIERARTEALIDLGIDQVALRAARGVVFAVRRVTVEYYAPARFQELLEVRTALIRAGGATVDIEQEVWRGDTPLVHAEVRVVCLGTDGRARRMPAEVREALGRLAGASLERG